MTTCTKSVAGFWAGYKDMSRCSECCTKSFGKWAIYECWGCSSSVLHAWGSHHRQGFVYPTFKYLVIIITT